MTTPEFQVEKGVPVKDGRGVPAKYPWEGMEVGDSFRADVHHTGLRSCARWQAKKRGTAYLVRVDGNGSRVWRTA